MAAASKPLSRRVRELVDVWSDLFGRHNILVYASAIAFQTLVALFPLLLLGLALLAATGHQGVWVNDIAPTVQRQVTPPVYDGIDFTVRVIFASKTAGVILFALVLSVWEVSRSVRACMGGMNAIYETEERRPSWLLFAISFGLAVAIITCLAGAAVLLTFAKGPGGDSALHWLVLVARWAGAIFLLGLAVGLLFRYAPVEPRETRWESAGATLVVAVWLGTSIGFKYYLTSVANLKTAVGSLTVFVVLTTYFYVSSIIFMVGVQLDELLREHERHPGTGLLDLVLRGE
jgi:membrane protein